MKHTTGCSELRLLGGEVQPLGKYIADKCNIHAVGIGEVIVLSHVVKHVKNPEGALLGREQFHGRAEHVGHINGSIFLHDIIDLVF